MIATSYPTSTGYGTMLTKPSSSTRQYIWKQPSPNRALSGLRRISRLTSPTARSMSLELERVGMQVGTDTHEPQSEHDLCWFDLLSF